MDEHDGLLMIPISTRVILQDGTEGYVVEIRVRPEAILYVVRHISEGASVQVVLYDFEFDVIEDDRPTSRTRMGFAMEQGERPPF